MPKLTVEYFASLREQAGIEREELTSLASTYGELYEELRRKHGFTLPLSMIQLAVNDEFSALDNPCVEGVNVVFIPPIAGG